MRFFCLLCSSKSSISFRLINDIRGLRITLLFIIAPALCLTKSPTIAKSSTPYGGRIPSRSWSKRTTDKFKYELDLEVIAYGRNYTGKKVGPYARLLVYEAGEEIIRQGDWGGNTFFFGVEGDLDVYVKDQTGKQKQVDVAKARQEFWRDVCARRRAAHRDDRRARRRHRESPQGRATRASTACASFRSSDRRWTRFIETTVCGERLTTCSTWSMGHSTPSLVKKLSDAARVQNLQQASGAVSRGRDRSPVFSLSRSGWLKREHARTAIIESSAKFRADEENAGVDFLGAGNCLGIEALEADTQLEIHHDASGPHGSDGSPHWLTCATIASCAKRCAEFFFPSDAKCARAAVCWTSGSVAAAEKEIATGIVDGSNLLVMDMDLCMRCGNCSLACHKVHGQSRLLRRGIHIKRPVKPGSSFTQHVLSPSVCLHCQDPECLTGCPTGAIARFPGGQIDIDVKDLHRLRRLRDAMSVQRDLDGSAQAACA